MQRRVYQLGSICCLAAAMILNTASLAAAQDCPHCNQGVAHGDGVVMGGGEYCNGCPNCRGGGASAFLGKGPLARAYCRRGMTHCRGPEYGDPDLFRNYWVGPGCDPGCDCNGGVGGAGGAGGGGGGVAAQLYIAPHPTPAYVGHVYYTNEALMPHELLYNHKRFYRRYYNEGRGMTRAKVKYYTPIHIAMMRSIQSFIN